MNAEIFIIVLMACLIAAIFYCSVIKRGDSSSVAFFLWSLAIFSSLAAVYLKIYIEELYFYDAKGVDILLSQGDVAGSTVFLIPQKVSLVQVRGHSAGGRAYSYKLSDTLSKCKNLNDENFIDCLKNFISSNGGYIGNKYVNSTDGLLAGMPKGSAAVSAPKEVLQYEGFDVVLRLENSELDKLLKSIGEEAARNTEIKGVMSNVSMSHRMKAELVGEDFEIQEKGPQEQAVTVGAPTIWSWRVRSSEFGELFLKVRLHTLVMLDGKESPRTLEISQTKISVIVNPVGWMKENWQIILTAVVLPVLAWWLKRYFFIDENVVKPRSIRKRKKK